MCTAGMGVLFLALILLAWLPEGASILPVIWRLALAGIGTALFSSPNTSAAMSAVPLSQRGVASGMVATARNLGMVIGIALAGAIFHGMFQKLSGGVALQQYDDALAPAFKAAFNWAMCAGAVTAAIGLILAHLRGPDRK